MAKEIVLADGRVALVSDEDYDFLKQWPWQRVGKYVGRNPSREESIYLHKIIGERMGLDPLQLIDHKDRNKLNNVRENLRQANKQQNKANSDIHCNNTSGYKGVSWHRRHRMWQAYIKINYKCVHIGYFACPKQAAIAYNLEAKRYFGDFALLNEVN